MRSDGLRIESENSSHVIMFYCGPSDNKFLMLEIGNKLVELMNYKNDSGAMFYKVLHINVFTKIIHFKIKIKSRC